MKNYVALFMLFAICASAHSQEHKKGALLKNENNWGVEHFPLPTGFAQEMTVTGIEEAYFAPGCSDPESDQMWSYVFVWKINADKPVAIPEIELNLERYFNGLMDIPKDTIVAPKLPANALVIEKITENGLQEFSGKVRTFDKFRSQQMMTLHLELSQYICPTTKKAVLLFRFSPKPFEHNIWSLLKSLTIQENACDD